MLIDKITGTYLRKGENYGNHDTDSCRAIVELSGLLGRLDEAIDDMEQGRVQTIEEAWAEIDAI